MHCRQTHRQVIMDYSVGRETDTTPEVCLSVCVSVYSSVECFPTNDVGRSIISQILSQMASCLLNSSRLLLCWGEGCHWRGRARKSSAAVRLRLTIGNPPTHSCITLICLLAVVSQIISLDLSLLFALHHSSCFLFLALNFLILLSFFPFSLNEVSNLS